LPPVSQWPPHFEGFLLNEVGMKTMNIELAREAGGMLICAVAIGWLGYFRHEGRKSERAGV